VKNYLSSATKVLLRKQNKSSEEVCRLEPGKKRAAVVEKSKRTTSTYRKQNKRSG
jgi:hypothetical protein